MATNRKEIEEELQKAWMADEAAARLFGFTAGTPFDDVYAKVSLMRLLFRVVATVTAAKEKHLEDWKEEVRRVADETHYGTEAWWEATVKAWQPGDPLVLADGRLGYAEPDESRRVVSSASLRTIGRTLHIKVARGEAGSLQPLAAAQLQQLQGYVERVKPAGVRVAVSSAVANNIGLIGEVRYTAELDPADVRQRVGDALAALFADLRFGGTLHAGRILAAIVGVEGVEDARIDRMTIDGEPWSDTVEPPAGHCRLADDRLTYIAIVA